MKKLLIGGGVVVAIVIAFGVWRSQDRRQALREQQEQLDRERARSVDLGALPPAQDKVAEAPPPKFTKKPILLEMKLKKKGGKPFKGKYELVNAQGDIVGQEEALGDGVAGVFIVSPGYYNLRIPGSRFTQKLTVLPDSTGKMQVDIVVAAK